jgi:hypothetical protein
MKQQRQHLINQRHLDHLHEEKHNIQFVPYYYVLVLQQWHLELVHHRKHEFKLVELATEVKKRI